MASGDLFQGAGERGQAAVPACPAPKRRLRRRDADSVATAYSEMGVAFDKVVGHGASRAHPEAVASLVLAAEIAALLHIVPRTPNGEDSANPERHRKRLRTQERGALQAKLLPLWARITGKRPATVASVLLACARSSGATERALLKILHQIGGEPISARRVALFLRRCEGHGVNGLTVKLAGYNNDHVGTWLVRQAGP